MVHTAPVEEVMMVPSWPTDTKVPLPKATPFRDTPVPELSEVQTAASGEVMMKSSSPAATKVPLPYAMPFNREDGSRTRTSVDETARLLDE